METTSLGDGSFRERIPCIWMQAGVVSRKRCDKDYDCYLCPFDFAMGKAVEKNSKLRKQGKTPKGKRGEFVSWKEKLRGKPSSSRPCIHHMKGRIRFRPCTDDYKCGSCEFDQFFNDQYTVHAVVKPIDFFAVRGFKVPQGYYLHHGHAWTKIEHGSSVRVGIDDFASRIFGPLDSIEVPLMGKEVRRGQPDITLHRGKHSSKVISPVTGVVKAVHAELREDARFAGEDPYTEGWLMILHAGELREDLRHLMLDRESSSFLQGEVDRFYELMEEVAGPLAADGGNPAADIYGAVPQLGWERLTGLFLRT